MSWIIDTASSVPPSAQLVERALDLLSAGVLEAGDRLPSVRSLAAEARVNPNTAARAWRELEYLEVARGENGRGVFVTAEGPAIAAVMRKETTLAALASAARAARRAGHDTETLLAHVRASLEEPEGQQSKPNRRAG